MNKIEIKKATLSDLSKLADLFNKYRIFYKKEPDAGSVKTFVKARLEEGDSEIFLCIDVKGEIMGFMQLYPIFSSINMKKLWLLNDLYIDADNRGKGYSKLLIDKAKELCSQTNAYGLILETSKDNLQGNRLYQVTGFDPDTEHNFYSWTL